MGELSIRESFASPLEDFEGFEGLEVIRKILFENKIIK